MKTRTDTRTRTVPKTIDGKTHQVQETYTVDVPVLPPDRDAQGRIVVMVLAALFVTGAVVWSTLAIGGMLSMAFTPWAAYMIAAVFDGAWIGFMLLEWLARFEPEKAREQRRNGWLCLLLSMVLITAHGAVHWTLWIGLAGAGVSLLAKYFWASVMKVTSPRLAPESAEAQWAAKERAEADAKLATVAVRRQLARTEARIREEESALGSGSRVTELEWIAPATDGLTADRLKTEVEETAERIRTAQSGGSGPVRIDPDSGSTGSVKDRVRALYESGTTDTDDIVRALPDANAETVKRHVRTVRSEGGYA